MALATVNGIEGLRELQGQKVGRSEWREVTQELINTFALAIKFGITARQLHDHVYAYPTFCADIKHMLGHG